MQVLRKGAQGRPVRELQTLLQHHGFWTHGSITEFFGDVTEAAVIQFQRAKGIKADGIVGPETMRNLLDRVDADALSAPKPPITKPNRKTVSRLGVYSTADGLEIDRAYLSPDEYILEYGKIDPVNFFIHDTTGWDNPYNTVHDWNTDKRGRVATQYVIGGNNIQNKNLHDGRVVECFPNNYFGWHTGKVGNHMLVAVRSVGVELNNFGFLREQNGKFYTWTNVEVPKDQVCDLGFEHRGHRFYHAYSTKQIETLRLLLKHVQKIYPNINIQNGLPALLKNGVSPKEAFSFNEDAYWGRTTGLWTHTNVRSDKLDCSPQPILIEMLKSL
jgi:N-acetyl-anhydromuramyl-L-alanine amidase AmpD